MKKILLLMLVVMLTACGKSESTDTVDSLAANPERLKELREQCKTDRAKLGDELCNRVASTSPLAYSSACIAANTCAMKARNTS